LKFSSYDLNILGCGSDMYNGIYVAADITQTGVNRVWNLLNTVTKNSASLLYMNGVWTIYVNDIGSRAYYMSTSTENPWDEGIWYADFTCAN